jgi:hypothetical protein
LLDGAASIPGVDLAQLERIWPVVVTAGGTLFQSDLLWGSRRGRGAGRAR